MSRRNRTSRPKLSPAQILKASIIRLGLAKKVKVRNPKPGPDGTRTARIQFQFIWHRVAMVFAALMLLGWISAAVGGYIFVRVAREFPEVRFVDIAFPHRWDHYRVSLGDYYIEQAKERLEKGETDGVVQFIRVGVQQSPDNKEGRLMLAGLYNAIGRPDLGIDVLQERVDQHAEDLEYLNALISMLFNNHEDLAVQELADRFLGDSTEASERNLVLALAAATAHFNRGNYERAQQIVDTFELTESRTGTLLQARIEWDLGNSTEAIALLQRVLQNPGDLEGQVIDYLIDYLWKSGQETRARQVAVNQFIADPLSFGPRIRLLYIHNKRGEQAKEQEDIDAFFELFGREEPAMHALAEFAAQTANPALAERVYEHVRARNFASEGPALALIQARVAANDFAGALAFHGTIEELVPHWTPLQQSRLKPLLTAAYFGAGDSERGEALLNEVLVLRRGTNPEWMMALSQRLIEMGRPARARDLLQHIHSTQPLNQEALTQLIHLDLKLENNEAIVRNIERLLRMRKPSPDVLENAHTYISSDRFLFQPDRDKMLQSLETALVSGRSRDS